MSELQDDSIECRAENPRRFKCGRIERNGRERANEQLERVPSSRGCTRIEPAERAGERRLSFLDHAPPALESCNKVFGREANEITPRRGT
jgi:hypothetical protein